MQAQIAQQIVVEMNAHMTQSGITLDRWYVGVSDAWDSLFTIHKVPRAHRWFICRCALNHLDARAIQQAYRKAGSAGPREEGNDTAVYVYAYVITPETVQ
ncbi:MAG: hypothetical protein WDN28_07295 [Chthoniobacter sp.]